MLCLGDIETSGRCALATLAVLDGEVRALNLDADKARKMGALMQMAREHIAEVIGGDCEPTARPIGPDALSAVREVDGAAEPYSLAESAAEAWAAIGEFRNATTGPQADASRARLLRIRQGSRHEQVRRLASRVLGTEAG